MASITATARKTLGTLYRNRALSSQIIHKGYFSTSKRLAVAGINDDLYGLTDDQKDFRQTVHDFCVKELGPVADQIDKDNGWSGLRWVKIINVNGQW